MIRNRQLSAHVSTLGSVPTSSKFPPDDAPPGPLGTSNPPSLTASPTTHCSHVVIKILGTTLWRRKCLPGSTAVLRSIHTSAAVPHTYTCANIGSGILDAREQVSRHNPTACHARFSTSTSAFAWLGVSLCPLRFLSVSRRPDNRLAQASIT